jgi:AraC family transcriptional regulator
VELYRLGDVEFSAPHAEHLVSVQLTAGASLYQRRAGREAERRVRRGEVIVTPAGEPKTWRRRGEGELLVIAMAPRVLDGVLREVTGRAAARAQLLDNFGTHDAAIEALAFGLWRELREPMLGSTLYAEAAVRQVALHLLRRHCGAPPPEMPAVTMPPHKLRRARAYIDAHVAEDLRVESIARSVDMSPFHFAHAFRQATGMPPHRYVVEQRIEHAKALLRDTRLPLAEVAQRVGYSSQSHFSVAFHKALQLTPSEFRRRS